MSMKEWVSEGVGSIMKEWNLPKVAVAVCQVPLLLESPGHLHSGAVG